MADDFLASTLAETDDTIDELEGEQKESKTEEMLRRILDENRVANADLIRQVVGANKAQPGKPLQEDDPLAGIEIKTDDLPDPAHDPAGFHREYAKRAHGAMRTAAQRIEERTMARMQRTLTDRELFDKAETLVKTSQPDASKEVIAAATKVVADRLVAQGKDPMSELRGNVEGIAQDVADYIDDLRSQLAGERRRSEGGNSRARGLNGSSPRTPTARKPAEKAHDPLELLHDIQKMQREHRLY